MKVYISGFKKNKVTVFARTQVGNQLKLVSSVADITEFDSKGRKQVTSACVKDCLAQASNARNALDKLGSES